ncbi:MAG: hypothetical protein OXT71_01900 [Acidobacteriota bacterium]|nr:hypothetical protein [Acidobacteriota bacterium]
MTRHQATVDGIDFLGRKTSVPLIRGACKRLPNNPLRPDGTIHVYCPPEQVDSEIGPVTAVTDSVFLINYKERPDEAAARFSTWLEDAIVRSLKLWQETAP